MPKKKKTKSTARFGARYGKKVKLRVLEIEKKQRKKQKCPFCGKKAVKRIASGIWFCKSCRKKFTSKTYFLE